MTNHLSRAFAGIVLCLTSIAAAKVLPLLDPVRVRLISQEISGDAAFKHVRFLSMLHRPRVSEKLVAPGAGAPLSAKQAIGHQLHIGPPAKRVENSIPVTGPECHQHALAPVSPDGPIDQS